MIQGHTLSRGNAGRYTYTDGNSDRRAIERVRAARARRQALAAELAKTLRRTRGAGYSDAIVLTQLSGAHAYRYWTILGEQAGVTAPVSDEARKKVVDLAKRLAGGAS